LTLLMPGVSRADFDPFQFHAINWFDAGIAWELATGNSTIKAIENAPVPADLRVPTPDQLEQSRPVNRPVVKMYTASWCGPCQQAHRSLEQTKNLPFTVQYIDEPDHPGWLTSLPTFEWTNRQGKPELQLGWPGVEALTSRWKSTRQDAATRRTRDNGS
jgi:thiol-disulfide isomerase/thioredoxin